MSLKSLWDNKAYVWCIGLTWGWLGPLLIMLLGVCSNASPSIYGYPHVSNTGGNCMYHVLTFSDGLITFPLCYVGQLIVSM